MFSSSSRTKVPTHTHKKNAENDAHRRFKLQCSHQAWHTHRSLGARTHTTNRPKTTVQVATAVPAIKKGVCGSTGVYT